MKLQNIFAKPVDRPIEGVIKADDLESLKLEFEEYVITAEIAKSLDEFLKAYNDYYGANGIWISGFFGSGKSHLLKILALLLENKAIDGTPAIDYFEEKFPNKMLKADMKRAVSIPSKSILFNIDQKADTISKTETDAVLAVFVKVFNEMQGFYGKQGYIAQMERDFSLHGIYENFKKAFLELAGKEWERGREEIIIQKKNVAQAFAQVSGEAADDHKNIVDAYRDDYKLSIEDFAEQVNDFIRQQEPNFRLNFFVDEVGQYIADNVKLMTNLQTIAESLATKCKGQAWILVTAQGDMDKILGRVDNQTIEKDGQDVKVDFSKIQARFKTRMKLTSQNVNKVIEQRLLKKNEGGERIASKLYAEKKNSFGTLFEFADGAKTYRNFTDKQRFIDTYPFIPYQFTLFQTSILEFSNHNAFEGQHRSVGERSMLEVFQNVAKQISDKEEGELATFDLMFEGIRATLKSLIQKSILDAENHLENPFAIKVLKALFLVKYVKGFNATPRNLRVLLQENFDRDLPALRKEIEEALNLLEQQTYIQRNGDVYEYLTDEEKDIEEEIKRTDIDTSEVLKDLGEVLFSGIIRDPKIRYEGTKQDYRFTKKLDDRITSKEYELAIHFVTPLSENIERIEVLQGHSLDRAELMIVFPPDSRLVKDLKLYKRTEKHIRINRSAKQIDTVLTILDSKARQNNERYKLIQNRVGELVGRARFFVRGVEVEVSGEDPKSRIIKGFNELVVRTYPQMRMLGSAIYHENDIKQHLLQRMIDSPLTEAEQEIFATVNSNKTLGTKSTMKSLEEKFTKKPYGWHLAAIQCMVAILSVRGILEIKSDSNLLEGDDLERALKNTHGFANLIIDPQPDFTRNQIRLLKEFFNDFFNQPATSNEAKALGNETRETLRDFLGTLNTLSAQRVQYPFLSVLDDPIHAISELLGKDYSFYLERLPEQEDSLLDMKENILDPIRSFMSGGNKKIYDEAREFIQKQNANFDSVGNGHPEDLKTILADPECYKGNQMKEAKKIADDLKKEVEKQLKEEKEQALKRAEDLHQLIHTMPDYDKLDKDQKEEIDQSFDGFEYQIKEQSLIAVVRDRASRYEADEYSRLLTQVSAWANDDEEEKIEYITQSDLGVKFEKPYLEDEEDVDSYLSALKKAMLNAIKANKRIRR